MRETRVCNLVLAVSEKSGPAFKLACFSATGSEISGFSLAIRRYQKRIEPLTGVARTRNQLFSRIRNSNYLLQNCLARVRNGAHLDGRSTPRLTWKREDLTERGLYGTTSRSQHPEVYL